jgi:hypothetical protein
VNFLFSIGSSLTITPVGGDVLFLEPSTFSFLVEGGEPPYTYETDSILPPSFFETWTFLPNAALVQFTPDEVPGGSLLVELTVTDNRGVRKSAAITFTVINPQASLVLAAEATSVISTEGGAPLAAY